MICITPPPYPSNSTAAISASARSEIAARRVFVCEYITGGGLYREAIPLALAQEALLMRNAMLEAMLALGMQVSVVHDPRLPEPALSELTPGCDVHILQSGEDPWALWQQAVQDCDLVWLVAPESGGALERLSAMVLAANKGLLSCPPEAVALAASKYDTYCRLQGAALNLLPSWRAQEFFVQPASSKESSLWVAKPDDGISCEGTALFQDIDAMRTWLSAGRMESYVIQPYIVGESASLSMLCRDGQAWLLSCNTQLIAQQQDTITSFQYQGSVVNGMAQHWARFAEIAAQVTAAMPELFGYVGVDLLMDEAGELHILEVNPRLTTSFAGIAQAIGYNPACLLIDLFYNEHFTLPPDLQRNRIEIKLND